MNAKLPPADAPPPAVPPSAARLSSTDKSASQASQPGAAGRARTGAASLGEPGRPDGDPRSPPTAAAPAPRPAPSTDASTGAALRDPVAAAADGAPPATPPDEAALQKQQAEKEADAGPAPSNVATFSVRHVHAIATVGIFVFVLFLSFYFLRSILFPVALAALLTLLLSPLVKALARLHVPPPLGALLVVLAATVSIGYGLYLLVAPVSKWIDKAPTALREAEFKLRVFTEPLEEIAEAEKQLKDATGGKNDGEKPVPVRETTTLTDQALGMTRATVVDLFVTLVLLYFLLAGDDRFIRKVVEIMPRLQQKKHVVEIAREVKQGISRYLFSVTIINAGLGVAVGVTMALLKMPNPVLWGVMAAILNFIPYVGALAGITIIGLVGLVTYPHPVYALGPACAYLVLTALEGMIITPMILGIRLSLSPVAILLSLLFWGWLWGIPGALLAVPMLAAFTITCEHIGPLEPVARMIMR